MEQKLRRDCNLGDNLRRLRNASGLSQEKLCAELQRRGCDIGRTTYAKYEAGELNVRVSVLLALKRLYGCPYDATKIEEVVSEFVTLKKRGINYVG